MNKKIKKLLYRSFDKPLKKQEQTILEKVLEESPELVEEKSAILKMRTAISNNKTELFKPFFAGRVMSKINSLEKQSGEVQEFESLFSVFRPVAICAFVLIMVIVSYNWINNGQLSGETDIYNTEISIADAFDPMLRFMEEQ